MATLEHVEDLCHLALADAGADRFPDATVEAWIVEAIREYSRHFPRVRTTTLTCVAGQHNYTVPADGLAVLQVEYPRAQDPPQYTRRLSRRSPNFWAADGCYDVEMSGEGGGTLWLSASPSAGQSIGLTYAAPHDTDLESGDTVTVPDPHLDLLVAYVVWRGLVEILGTEEQSPDTTIHLIRDMDRAAESARRSYEAKLGRARGAEAPSAVTPGWRMDGDDPVY